MELLQKPAKNGPAEVIDSRHSSIVPTESDLPSLYYFSNTPEGELIDCDASDLKYGTLPPERALDVSSPDTANEQRVKSLPTV